ncbi:hypothetical protein AQ490_20750 [Wenjunlia vitaminophila]|uniref:HTH luxR-type domain-containing protein n=1 Tax=Wenjunlia vitaminophila TaxID=76728 RepID=A0A0T6LTT6_WENVI|nr:LuxR family transcriptional regulator [Wenjunlia vitaminophila]KRV49416.1 hypothetical protein AQ490_20750 [Wenjunlia vitaminophila]
MTLDALGLTGEETHIYTELVRFGSCEVERLPALLGLEPGRIDQALHVLADQGLVTLEGRETPTVIASPPDIAGEVLLLRRMQELLAARAKMARLTDEYRSRALEPRVKRVPVQYTPGVAIPQFVDQVQRRARREVLIFDAPPYVLPLNEREWEQLAAGVSYRSVYSRESVERPGGLALISRYIEAGEEARVASRLPLKMMIVDRELGVLATPGGDGSEPGGVVMVHTSSLLDGLIDLFERVWAEALPLGLPGEEESAAAAELDPVEVQVLTLLLSGLTDEVIARQLGMGRRTVLRRVRSLMDRAGVATRVQLGWYAARRDWIELARRGPSQPPSGGSAAEEVGARTRLEPDTSNG